MALSDAAKMTQCLAALVWRRPLPWPRSTWAQFVETSIGTEPSSPNRQEGANACEALWLMNEGKSPGRVREILDFEHWYHTLRPFMANEPMTKEPVYRVLHAYTPGIFSALGAQLTNPAERSAAHSARAHAGWLTLGLAMRPHRRILDHQPGAREGCVLVGTGKPKTGLRYVAQAGQRSFVRAGKSVRGDVEFVDAITCQVIIAQVMGGKDEWRYPKKSERTQADLYDGFLRRWPGLHPFALSASQTASIAAFASNPPDPRYAAAIVTLLRAPGEPYRVDRYSGGTVVTLLEGEQSSSTDEVMIDVAYANGEIRWATCSDGVRSTQEDQEGFEETGAYACRKPGSPIVHRVAKPHDEFEAWSVRVDSLGQIAFEAPGWQSMNLPETGEVDTPPQPARRAQRWWDRIGS